MYHNSNLERGSKWIMNNQTKNYFGEKVQYEKGVMYVRVGNNFNDSVNVYLESDIGNKVGEINFIKNGKKRFNHRGKEFMEDGFVFEPVKDVIIMTKDYQHIARYIYRMNNILYEVKNGSYGSNKNKECNDE